MNSVRLIACNLDDWSVKIVLYGHFGGPVLDCIECILKFENIQVYNSGNIFNLSCPGPNSITDLCFVHGYEKFITYIFLNHSVSPGDDNCLGLLLLAIRLAITLRCSLHVREVFCLSFGTVFWRGSGLQI